jgi:hypothetical protein
VFAHELSPAELVLGARRTCGGSLAFARDNWTAARALEQATARAGGQLDVANPHAHGRSRDGEAVLDLLDGPSL